jgi:choline dehydrogenase-like flavoprotein
VRRHPASEFSSTDTAFMESAAEHGIPIDRDMNAPDSYGVGALTTNSVEIVLSSGAIKSAHLLMLSGIGPAPELARQGISVVFDNRNVGKDFTEHVQGGMIVYRLPEMPKLDPERHPVAHVGMHYTAEGSSEVSDMMSVVHCLTHNSQLLHERSLLGTARMGLRLMRTMSVRRVLDEARLGNCLGVGVALMKGNNRGEITLTSADPTAKPRIEYRHLDHAEDRAKLRSGMRLNASLVEGQAFKALGARRLSPTNAELASDAELDRYLHRNLFTYFHMAGTCRMGPDSDDTAVVDQHCRVRGVERLRVVDTSIWPETVRRCTNASAVRTGERAADLFA